jgi:hypothetical protein
MRNPRILAWALVGMMGSVGFAWAEDSVKSATAVRRPIIAASAADDVPLPPAPMPERDSNPVGAATAIPPPQNEVVPSPDGGILTNSATANGILTNPATPNGILANSVMDRVNGWGERPPPGTLGRTYRRRSALVSDDVHPRTGVVLVYLPEQADVSARGLKVTWTGDVWRLETDQALIPGVPHIYAVKAEWDTPEGPAIEVRWVRLIMGRVVDLDFE